MHIKGTPVSLSRNQLGINFNTETPSLNTGIFLTRDGKSTRNIKIVNNGPNEVLLRWVVYPMTAGVSDRDLFEVNFVGAQPGTEDVLNVSWNAIKPKPVDKCGFSISPMERVIKGREETNFVLTIEESNEIGKFQNLLVGEPFLI